MLTKDNVTIGIEWRFGPDWPGQRCGAKTRRGTACQRPANRKNGRCRLHGGASTGAKTEEGRARISAANLRHGKFTKDKLEKRRENAAKGREIRKELRQMERELVAGAGSEPRSMHKQNCFQLPQAGMALPDHDYIIVRFDVANTSGAVNDARH